MLNQFEAAGICQTLEKICQRIASVVSGEKRSTELVVAMCDLTLLQVDLESLAADSE